MGFWVLRREKEFLQGGFSVLKGKSFHNALGDGLTIGIGCQRFIQRFFQKFGIAMGDDDALFFNHGGDAGNL